ncbi:hypothetical protein LguiA_005099 [Lonicera macranthoides]
MRGESMIPEDRERSLAKRHYNYHQRRASTITLNENPSSDNSHARPLITEYVYIYSVLKGRANVHTLGS